MKELIKIQRFSLDDGVGIRTALFFKGCNLKCPYCCNPENMIYGIEYLKNNDKYDDDLFGKYYTIEDVWEIIKKDVSYFSCDGGVTYTGGEPYLHTDFLLRLSKILHDNDINITIESSLYCDEESIKSLMQYIDAYIVDIKTLDADVYREYFKGDIDVYFHNVDILKDKIKDMTFRITFVPFINDSDKDIDRLCGFIDKYKIDNIEICSVHNLAKSKYEKLGIAYMPHDIITLDRMDDIRKRLARFSKNVKINVWA